MYYKTPANSLHFLDDEIDPATVQNFPTDAVPISDEEAESLIPSPPEPTAAEKIRALEAQYSDAQAKLTRQTLLVLALDAACASPEAAGLTREQVHAALMSRDNGYSALFTLEQRVEELRAQL